MAALDHRNPNLDDFLGLKWSCWVDRVNILTSDAESNIEDSSKYERSCSETMILSKEDMHIYGQCPAHDDFFLVVCSQCGQVVKPQAFEKHSERRHSQVTTMCGQPSTLAPQQRPRPGWPINLSSSQERQKGGRCHEASSPSSAELPVNQHRPTKAHREAVSLPSVENPPLQHHSASSPRPRVPQGHSGHLPTGFSSSSASLSEKSPVHKPAAGQTSDSASPLRGTRTYNRIYKSIDKKECDLNKQGSVLDQERKKLCSHELICNTDAIHQQQGASGRAKSIDQLAGEERTASTGRDMEQLPVKANEKEQHLEALEGKIATQCWKYNFNNNCHILGRSRGPPESFPLDEGDNTVKVEVQPPYPFNQNLLSSEESEEDEQERTDLPATPLHPKPLGLCTFGCRTLGCSIFTFDRRLHHLRFALSAMLEHHVNTHLWKKLPQLSSGLRSYTATPKGTLTRRYHATGSVSLESTSLRHLEIQSSRHNSRSTKPPLSNTSASLEPGRRRTPVRKLSKEVDILHDACAAQKAGKLSQGCEDKPSRYIRETPLHDKGQPQIRSSHGPANGTSSHRKKPCPPLPLQPSERHLSALPSPQHLNPRSPNWKARPPAIQKKVVDNDQSALGQKRKGSVASQPLRSSLSRSSKCQRLSSPPCSSLISWKGESFGDVLSCGLEKRS